MLSAGDRVGDWVIEAPLGEGGMGAVYRVHSALTQRLVAALKVMKPTADPDARARFVREAEALSALRHPAVVRVMGFTEDRDRSLLYLVMELAVGETLRARVARGPMDVTEALATFVPLAQGLDHAHAAGIFHRDLKPSNVILCVDGTPRLVDFGIATSLHADPLTTTGHFGTLPYLPPEVFRGERADPAATDVYGFGLLLHEALTGQRSFAVDAASTPAAAAAAIGVRKLQSPTVQLPEGFPERLRELVRRATDGDPAVRPSMRELREELESAVERRAIGAVAGRVVPVPAPPVAADEATTRVPDPPSVPIGGQGPGLLGTTASRVGRRRSDRTRSRLLAAAAVVSVLFGVGLVLSARSHGPESVAAGAPPPAARAPAVPPPRRARVSPAPAPSATASGAPRRPAAASPSPHASPTSNATPAPERTPRPTPTPTPAPEADEEPPPADRPEPRPEEPPATAPDAPPQVGGRWELQHDVESTQYEPFAGMRLGYRLTLVQEGSRVYGQGRKVSENGVMLPPAQRTPIDVAGEIRDGRLVLHFTEIGRERTSSGTMRLQLDPGGAALHGRFASDAADSSGTSSGRRLPQ